jgi:hypothetical protein
MNSEVNKGMMYNECSPENWQQKQRRTLAESQVSVTNMTGNLLS